jgi:uncharacterized protein (TIGR03032 family)
VEEAAFHYVHSPDLPGLLEHLGISLLVSTYQAGKLMAVRAAAGRVSMLLRSFDQAMGLALAPGQLALGTRHQIWFLHDAHDLAPQIEPAGQHDACFLPRACHVTGDIRVHELAWAGEELWIVNTRFSCLCTLRPEYSFVPRWRPPFVTALAAEDRCHLNGLMLADGRPKYVTVLGATDSPEGWRPNKIRGGCLIDVPSGEIVARELSMPHSPRIHAGQVWVLESGEGRVLVVDPATGHRETVIELPGYPRGLAFHGGYAFVALSHFRRTALRDGLPVTQRHKELKCGVWVLDCASGRTVAVLQFDKGVEDIFDVQVLSQYRFPAILGFQKETINNVFVVPGDEHVPFGPPKSISL